MSEFISIEKIINDNLVPQDFKIRSRYFKSLVNNLPKLEKMIKEPDKQDYMTQDMIEGSLLDLLITEGNDAINEKFFISTAQVPTDKTKLFVDAVIKRCGGEPHTQELVAETAKEIGFGAANWKPATLEAKFVEWLPYAEEIKSSDGRIIVDMDTYQKICNLKDLAFNHHATSYLFNTGRRIYKPLIEFDITEFVKIMYRNNPEVNIPVDLAVKVVSELDMIFIDDEKKIIYPVEIKTYSESFLKSYYRFKYYYQLAIYYLALSESLKKNKAFVDEYKLEGYRLIGPIFLALNKAREDVPRIYQPTANHLTVATTGGVFDESIKHTDGWLKLSLDLLWHIVNDKYEYEKKVYENNCIEIIH